VLPRAITIHTNKVGDGAFALPDVWEAALQTQAQSQDGLMHAHLTADPPAQGDITVKLFPDECPKTVENFTTHAKNG